MGGCSCILSVVSEASKMGNIFSHQTQFQAIQLHLCSLPILILQILGQGQSERNLEIGLSVILSEGQVARPYVKV